MQLVKDLHCKPLTNGKQLWQLSQWTSGWDANSDLRPGFQTLIPYPGFGL